MSTLKTANAQLLPDERANELPHASRLQARICDVIATYGPPELCAWQVAPGVFWIQTTEPRFSRKLEKRRDARRVEVSGVNHFRRTFEIRGRWRKVQRIIDRFLMSTGDRFSGDFRPQNASKKRGSITMAGGHNGQK